jgi:UDP-glucuronate 4-epimerase
MSLMLLMSYAEGRLIKAFNYGKMQRDFTYIEDIVEVSCVAERAVAEASGVAPRRSTTSGIRPRFISRPHRRLRVCSAGAAIRNRAATTGDVPSVRTIKRLAAATGFAPATPLRRLASFVQWYREYYGEGKSA